METPNRDEKEYELAAALLLLWLMLDGVQFVGNSGWQSFITVFNKNVRPVLVRIYGQARATIAEQFGHQYEVVTTPEGPSVKLPGLNRTIDEYAKQVYESFQKKQADETARKIETKEPRPFQESDAERIAVTTISDLQTRGEQDGAKDVETRVGSRLQAVWRTEPGACPQCSPLDGTVQRWRQEWPSGPPRHPNCCLPDTVVSLPFDCTTAMKAQYKGLACRITTSAGVFALTENHEIPLDGGTSKKASGIIPGDKLFTLENMPYQESAASLFAAAVDSEEYRYCSTPAAPGHFHGDGKSMTGTVEIVSMSKELRVTEKIRRRVGGLSILSSLPRAEVREVKHFHYAGPVYDFSGRIARFYTAGGILVHNCRCHLDWQLFNG